MVFHISSFHCAISNHKPPLSYCFGCMKKCCYVVFFFHNIDLFILCACASVSALFVKREGNLRWENLSFQHVGPGFKLKLPGLAARA